jgi:sigma-B regulation protein RsbU (phosphoserine phosphatase)
VIKLSDGDTLLLYTDGMTDCRNPLGESFGLDRIKNLFGSFVKNNGQQICDQLLDALLKHQHGSKQDDDVTLVTIQIK